jgi:hypothetical protein
MGIIIRCNANIFNTNAKNQCWLAKALLLTFVTRGINPKGLELTIQVGSLQAGVLRNFRHAAAHDLHLMLKVRLLKKISCLS